MGSPAASYLQGGHTLIKVSRVSFNEADAKNPNTSFKVAGKVLFSTNPENTVGETKTMNVGFKYPESARPNMVRCLVALKSVLEGKSVSAAEISKAEVLRLTGETQPLAGVIIAIDATSTDKESRKSSKNPLGRHTKYECVVPDDADLQKLAEIGAI